MAEENDWPTTADDYQLICQIGQGAFARVMKAHCPAKNMDVAIKIMDLEKVASSLEDIRREVQTMRLTNHPNILTCYSSFVQNEELWLVMRLMNMGSCLHAMNMFKKSGGEEGMKEEWVAAILKEALLGLQYIHEQGQIHRDVKAGNLLLDSDGTALLADFGVSGWLMEDGDRRKNRQTFVGTPCWMAPEVMEQVAGYDYKADIWSFGVTALELAKGYAPYAKYQPMKVLLLTLQEPPPSLSNYDNPKRGDVPFSRHFKDMVKLCLQKDPSKRPSTTTLLNHKFFKSAAPMSLVRTELLAQLDDISVTGTAVPEQYPGAGPLYASGVSTPNVGEGGAGGESKYVPGTTWVFNDEPPQTSEAKASEMDEFAAQFDSEIGVGEGSRSSGGQ